jgi:hypothetical protein
MQDYNEVNAFSVATDGSLTKLATHRSESIMHSYGAEGNSYISKEYSQSGSNLVLNSFNASTNSFTSKALVRQPNNMNCLPTHCDWINLLLYKNFIIFGV